MRRDVRNPFLSGTIGPGGAPQGNVIFGESEKSQSCPLELINRNGDAVSNIIELNNVRMNTTYTTNSD
jgi:hypothetical protein